MNAGNRMSLGEFVEGVKKSPAWWLGVQLARLHFIHEEPPRLVARDRLTNNGPVPVVSWTFTGQLVAQSVACMRPRKMGDAWIQYAESIESFISPELFAQSFLNCMRDVVHGRGTR